MLSDPELTKLAARAVGIQRGVDLVLYLAVLGGVMGFFAVSIRFRRLERQMTTLVRELSMLTPKHPDAVGQLGSSGQGQPEREREPEPTGEGRVNSSSS
jgi:hypothetical protein